MFSWVVMTTNWVQEDEPVLRWVHSLPPTVDQPSEIRGYVTREPTYAPDPVSAVKDAWASGLHAVATRRTWSGSDFDPPR